jgi:hypothetical protein
VGVGYVCITISRIFVITPAIKYRIKVPRIFINMRDAEAEVTGAFAPSCLAHRGVQGFSPWYSTVTAHTAGSEATHILSGGYARLSLVLS